VKRRLKTNFEEPRTVAKSELGTKRICPDTGRKFYDLGKTPVISPYTGKIVPIAPTPARSRAEAASPRAAVQESEVVMPEATEAEFVSLEEAEAEQRGKKPPKGTPAAVTDEEDVEVDDESLDDAAFIEEEEEGNADVSDIIGETIEKEDET
jgi:uncharacterized protein (TIGR02300 family)